MDVSVSLQSSGILSGLNKGIIFRIASLTQKMSFKSGEFLMREGTVSGFCYIIDKGRVQIVREHGQRKLILNEVASGELLGELSLIDGLPHSASVIALEQTETFAISAWDFKAQLQAYPEIALQLLPIIAKRLRQTQDKLAELSV